jgi:hypothetical protein
MKPPINPSSAAIEACTDYWTEELRKAYLAARTAMEELSKLIELKQKGNDAESS